MSSALSTRAVSRGPHLVLREGLGAVYGCLRYPPWHLGYTSSFACTALVRSCLQPGLFYGADHNLSSPVKVLELLSSPVPTHDTNTIWSCPATVETLKALLSPCQRGELFNLQWYSCGISCHSCYTWKSCHATNAYCTPQAINDQDSR